MRPTTDPYIVSIEGNLDASLEKSFRDLDRWLKVAETRSDAASDKLAKLLSGTTTDPTDHRKAESRAKFAHTVVEEQLKHTNLLLAAKKTLAAADEKHAREEARRQRLRREDIRESRNIERLQHVAHRGAVGSAIAAGYGIALAAPTISSIHTSADFQKGMSLYKGRVNMSDDPRKRDEDLQKIRELAFMEARRVGVSPSEALEGITMMGTHGMSTEDIESSLKPISNVVLATGEHFDMVANSMINLSNSFKIPMKDSGRIADMMTTASASSAAGFSGLMEAMQYVAAPASAMGAGLPDAAAMISIASKYGLSASMAGTSTAGLMEGLLGTANPQQASQWNRLGISTFDFDQDGNRKFRSDLPELMGELAEKMSAIPDQIAQRQMIAGLGMGDTGMRLLSALMSKNHESGKYGWEEAKELRDNIRDSKSGSAAARAEYATESLTKQTEVLGASFNILKVTVGDAFLKPLTRVTKVLTGVLEWVAEMSDSKKHPIMAQIVSVVAAGLGIVGVLISGLAAVATAVWGFVAAAAAYKALGQFSRRGFSDQGGPFGSHRSSNLLSGYDRGSSVNPGARSARSGMVGSAWKSSKGAMGGIAGALAGMMAGDYIESKFSKSGETTGIGGMLGGALGPIIGGMAFNKGGAVSTLMKAGIGKDVLVTSGAISGVAATTLGKIVAITSTVGLVALAAIGGWKVGGMMAEWWMDRGQRALDKFQQKFTDVSATILKDSRGKDDRSTRDKRDTEIKSLEQKRINLAAEAGLNAITHEVNPELLAAQDKLYIQRIEHLKFQQESGGLDYHLDYNGNKVISTPEEAAQAAADVATRKSDAITAEAEATEERQKKFMEKFNQTVPSGSRDAELIQRGQESQKTQLEAERAKADAVGVPAGKETTYAPVMNLNGVGLADVANMIERRVRTALSDAASEEAQNHANSFSDTAELA